MTDVPEFYHGEWYYYTSGAGHTVDISKSQYKHVTTRDQKETVYQVVESRKVADAGENAYHAKVLFNQPAKNCYMCTWIFHRTINILQVIKNSECLSSTGNEDPYDQFCGSLSPQAELVTYFRTTIRKVDCKSTFEGIYQFQYKQREAGGGFCDSDKSRIDACQMPGSTYVDNEVFMMRYGYCVGIQSSKSENIKFQCLGAWGNPETGELFAAIANLNQNPMEERFICLKTQESQQKEEDITKLYVMSTRPDCNELLSAGQGPIELKLKPVIHPRQYDEIKPACHLPSNYIGDWYTSDEMESTVKINSTHIYMRTQLDTYRYKESYFTCQQAQDSRYLLTGLTVGKCEIDYNCVDFMNRHDNIIRYRMGRPYRLTPNELSDPNYRSTKFLEACSWSAFNFQAYNWKYRTFILDPPNPIDCPIAGHYYFKQIGPETERYKTRIRGVTERPRMQVDCQHYESELKACRQDTKKISIDAERCATVDHLARPIGEYDEPDHDLVCVGYWMEDSKSYLITYEEEDSTSRFRCWVYQRIDFKNMAMSRALSSSCGLAQDAHSSTSEEGASLALELYENEREFDDCPQFFNDGKNPYNTNKYLEYWGDSATSVSCAYVTIFLCAIIARLFRQ